MPTFDVHQHLWPEELVSELASREKPPCLRGSVLVVAGEGEFEIHLEEHRPERRLELMDRDGTDVAIVSLQPTLGIEMLSEPEWEPLVAAWHAGARRLVDAAGGRFRAFAAGASLDGFAGACVPAGQIVHGGLGLDALLGELAGRGQILFVHPGPARVPAGAPPWWAAVVDYTAQMQAAYAAWLARREHGGPRPAAIFSMLAGGAPVQLERLASRGGGERLALDPTVFLEVGSYGRRAIELCLSTFGIRQLLYGSDLPVVDPRPTLHAVRGFGDAVADVLRDENATLLFG